MRRRGPESGAPQAEVRLARSDEYAEIGRVTLSAWEPGRRVDDPDWREFAQPILDVAGRAKVADVFVAVADGRIAGSVTLELTERIPDHHASPPLEPGEAHVRVLGVAPQFHRRGIATRLMEQCVIAAERAGKRLLTVNTSTENRVAQSLYLSLGFTRRADVVRGGRRVASFVLPLDPREHAGRQPLIRRAGIDDATFIRAISAYAARWREQGAVDTEPVMTDDHVARYVEGWGRPGDMGVVAEIDGKGIGASWIRLFDRERPGYGFIAESIPELSIAVLPAWRGRGTGSSLLRGLLVDARTAGFAAVSLSVELDNPARRLYRDLGFERVEQHQGSWTMRLDLGPPLPPRTTDAGAPRRPTSMT